MSVQNSLKRLITLALIIVALGGCWGCAHTSSAGTTVTGSPPTWQQTATNAYVATGLALSTGKATFDALAAAGTINADKKAQFDEVYKIAYDAYQATGTLLSTAIEATDTAEQKSAIAAYQAALLKLPALIAQVSTIVAEVQDK